MRLIVVSALNSSGTFFVARFPQARQLLLPYLPEQLRRIPWGSGHFMDTRDVLGWQMRVIHALVI
jgi:hypothetical protein